MTDQEQSVPITQCPHDAVDESLWRPRWGRRFKSYRELCLDCGATRCREPKRFRMGRWSPWTKGGRCCLRLSDEACANTQLRHCEGWVDG